jgi:hypothetical protein
MRTVALIALCIVIPASANGECDAPFSIVGPNANSKQQLAQWEQTAYKLHEDGRFDDELACRLQYSKLARETLSKSPKALDKYELYDALFLNELPLAFLLEGKNRKDEAEKIFRHNEQQLAHLRIAGNDIKSDNQLGLAHLLFSTGKIEEAQRICSHWKNRVKHNSDFASRAVRTNVPTPPLYDTPEVEIGRWNLACGEPQAGEHMLRTQIDAHPDMLAPYTALGNYYVETGAFSKALELSMQERRVRNRTKD